MEKLAKIQRELKSPKNQFNSFGKYNYRSCEDILEAVKPLLDGAILTLSDKIIEVGGRVYVRATATFTDGDYEKSVTAFAREPAERKGMDASQITGTASSYARKYALNGLFLIDDTKDADTMDNTKKPPQKPQDAPEPIKEDVQDFVTLSQLEAVDGLLDKLNLNRAGLGEWLVSKKKLSKPNLTMMSMDDATKMIAGWDTFSADLTMYCMNNKSKGE